MAITCCNIGFTARGNSLSCWFKKPVILLSVQTEVWQKLAASFPSEALEWRIIEISEDGQKARLRPQLKHQQVVTRLNEVFGLTGWSHRLMLISDEAISAELNIQAISKTAIVSLQQRFVEVAMLAEDAFVYAAEAYGMLPPLLETTWVDYDPEAKAVLYEPDLPLVPREIAEVSEKTAGQQAIDRLVDRLRQEGLGLEAAKLLNSYGGYGNDANTARELYAKLRALLVGRETALS